MKEKLKKINLPALMLLMLFIFVMISFVMINIYEYFIIAIILIWILSFKVKLPHFPIVLFILSIVSKLIVIFVFTPPIESDFLTMYSASMMLKDGNLDFTNWDYLIRWGYQMGHIVYQAFILKIFDNVLALKIINVLALSGTTLLIYFIVKKLLNENAARFSSLLYLIYVHPVMLTTILTNQHIPTVLFFLAYYLIICDDFNCDKYKTRYILSGVILGIGNIIRPEGMVFVLSLFLYFVLVVYKQRNFKLVGMRFLLLCVSYLIIVNGASLALEASGLSKSGLKNKDPLWKFVIGTNYKSGGWYYDNDTKYLGNTDKELAIIKKRTIDNPLNFAKLLDQKARIFWLGNNLYWSNSYLNDNNLKVFSHEFYGVKVNDYLSKFNNQIYMLAFVLSLIGLFSLFKKKIDSKINLFVLLTIVYFVIYLFIEIMIRYTYTPRVAIFILSGFGISYLVEQFKKKFLRT